MTALDRPRLYDLRYQGHGYRWNQELPSAREATARGIVFARAVDDDGYLVPEGEEWKRVTIEEAVRRLFHATEYERGGVAPEPFGL